MGRTGLEMTRAEMEAKGWRIEGNNAVPIDSWPPPNEPSVLDRVLGALGEPVAVVPMGKAYTHRYGFAPNGRAYKSKWEAQYAAEIFPSEWRDHSIVWWDYEGMRFRLADGTYYTPDFVCLTPYHRLVAREVKGFWREAARVRVKVCARCFPWLRIEIITRAKGHWHTSEVYNA